MRLRIWQRLSPLGQAAAAAPAYEGEVARLYETEAPGLRRRLARRVGPDLAADLAQSAFVRLLGRGREGAAIVDQPASYLQRIATNLANDDAKSSRRRCEHVPADDDTGLAAPDLVAQLEARDMVRRIEQAIAALPQRTREIFLAHRFEDLNYGDIARAMGVSVKTVEKHISLALRELHRAVGEPRDR